MRHHLLIAPTLIAAVGLGGCGEDAGAASEACDAFVAIDREFSINEDIEAGIAAIVAFVDDVADDVADEVEPLFPLLREDPEAAFESEEFATAGAAADDSLSSIAMTSASTSKRSISRSAAFRTRSTPGGSRSRSPTTPRRTSSTRRCCSARTTESTARPTRCSPPP